MTTLVRFPVPELVKGQKGDDGSMTINQNIGEVRFKREMLDKLTDFHGDIAIEGETTQVKSFRRLLADDRYGVFRNIKGGGILYQPFNAYSAKGILEQTELVPNSWNVLSVKSVVTDDSMKLFSKKTDRYRDQIINLLGKNRVTEPYEALNDYRVKISCCIAVNGVESIKSVTIAVIPIVQNTGTIDMSVCLKHFDETEFGIVKSLSNDGVVLRTEEYDLSPSVFTPNRNYTVAVFYEGNEGVMVRKGSEMVVNLSGYDPDEEQ